MNETNMSGTGRGAYVQKRDNARYTGKIAEGQFNTVKQTFPIPMTCIIVIQLLET
jgi:hypothetical protein